MVSKIIPLFCLLFVFQRSYGDSCKTLETDVTEDSRDFTSHSDYGTDSYSANADKCWIIESDVRIKLYVDTFHLQGQDSDGLCVDYIKVYDTDEDNDDNRRLGTFCGSEPFGTLISRGRRMRINFISNGDGLVFSGFKLKYKLYGTSDVDPGAYWKAGIIFLFIFVFVIVAAVIAVCAAFYTQKKLKPKVILIKKLKGKSGGSESRPGTAVPKYDITGKPTPTGHVYPSPIHPPNQVHPAGGFEMMTDQPMASSPTEPNPPPFNGQPGFGGAPDQNDPMATGLASQPRGRPATASHIRFEDQN